MSFLLFQIRRRILIKKKTTKYSKLFLKNDKR